MMQGFLFTNALQIPDLFALPYEVTSRISFVLFSVMFIVAVLHENLEALRDESDYTGFFLRVILSVSLLLFYTRFFVWIVYGTDLLSKALMPEEEFRQAVAAVFREITQKKDLGVLKFFSIITALNFITHMVAMAVLGVLTWLRFIFLSLLYVMGPLLIAAGVYKGTSQGLGFWLRSLVSVSLWSVVLSILMKVISAMNLTSIYLAAETNSASVFAANLLFILLFISVPLISNQITSRSGTLSGLGSAVIGIGSALMTKTFISFVTKHPYQKNRNLTEAKGTGAPGYK